MAGKDNRNNPGDPWSGIDPVLRQDLTDLADSAKSFGRTLGTVIQKESREAVRRSTARGAYQYGRPGAAQNAYQPGPNGAGAPRYDPAQMRENLRSRSRNRKNRAHGSGGALVLSVFSALASLGLLIGFFDQLTMFLYFSDRWYLLNLATLGLLSAAGLAGFFLSNRRYRAVQRQKRYLEALGTDKNASVQRMAERVQRPVDEVEKDLKWMIRKGYFRTAFYDDETRTFFTSAEDYRELQHLQEQAAQEAREERRRRDAEQQRQAEPGAAGRAAQISAQGREFLAQLRSSEACLDADAVEELHHMEQTCAEIFGWVDKHPDSTAKVRRFANYYMPTTLKMLDTCKDVQGQTGPAAENIRRDITGILHTLNLAYDNLRSSLLEDISMDISSEISALETMLQQDGLSPDQFSESESALPD